MCGEALEGFNEIRYMELFYMDIADANFNVKFDATAVNPSRDNDSPLITLKSR